MDLLWAESLSLTTIHAADFASALVSCARWALPLGRAGTVAAHSEVLPSTLSSDAQVSALADLGAATKSDTVKAVVLTACDDGETTQRDIAKVIEDVVGVKSGFHGSVISSFAKLNIAEVAEDANDKVRGSVRLLSSAWRGKRVASSTRSGSLGHPSLPSSSALARPTGALY